MLATVAVIAASIVLAAWITGWDNVVKAVQHPQYGWIGLLIGAQLAAYIGYTITYKFLYGLRLAEAALRTLYGFSPLSVRGGFAYDVVISSNHADRYKVVALSITEYLVLAPAVLGAAVYALTNSLDIPLSFSLPWIIGVPAGALVALGLVVRRHKLKGWIARAIARLLDQFSHMKINHWLLVLVGMAVYWTYEVVTMYGALQLFGGKIDVDALIIAFGSGYVLTRRSLPASFAGPMIIFMILVLHWLNVPFVAAFLATYSYLIASLLLPVGYLAVAKLLRRT